MAIYLQADRFVVYVHFVVCAPAVSERMWFYSYGKPFVCLTIWNNNKSYDIRVIIEKRSSCGKIQFPHENLIQIRDNLENRNNAAKIVAGNTHLILLAI